MIQIFLTVLVLLLASSSHADEATGPEASPLSSGSSSENGNSDQLEGTWIWKSINSNAAAKNVKNGNSVAPILGYDPTYGFLLGGAFFRGNTERPVTNLELLAMGTFHNNYAGDFKFTLWTPEDWRIGLGLGVTQFYDSYFGEGNKTRPDQQTRIQNYKYYATPSIAFRFSEFFSSEIRSELRYRRETGVNGVLGQTFFGNEFTPLFGLALIFDTRDRPGDSKTGSFLQTRFDYGPAKFSTRLGAENFLRTLLEYRQFFSIGSFLVFAAQIQGGATLGEPGYLYRYTLGGSTDMRGYQVNRLRGRHFYEGQLEARITFLEWLGIVGFGGVGDVADVRFSQFSRPKLTYGGGIRIGVPPDYVAKVRLDFGVAPDEKCFYLSFNEAF